MASNPGPRPDRPGPRRALGADARTAGRCGHRVRRSSRTGSRCSTPGSWTPLAGSRFLRPSGQRRARQSQRPIASRSLSAVLLGRERRLRRPRRRGHGCSPSSSPGPTPTRRSRPTAPPSPLPRSAQSRSPPPPSSPLPPTPPKKRASGCPAPRRHPCLLEAASRASRPSRQPGPSSPIGVTIRAWPGHRPRHHRSASEIRQALKNKASRSGADEIFVMSAGRARDPDPLSELIAS